MAEGIAAPEHVGRLDAGLPREGGHRLDQPLRRVRGEHAPVLTEFGRQFDAIDAPVGAVHAPLQVLLLQPPTATAYALARRVEQSKGALQPQTLGDAYRQTGPVRAGQRHGAVVRGR